MFIAIFAQVAAATTAPNINPGVAGWQYQVLMFLLATLGTVMTVAVPLVAKFVAKKFKLEGEAVIADRVDSIVKLGLSFAEEQVAKRAKTALEKHSSSEKLDMATAFILAQLKDEKLPQKSAEAIKNLIEAKLPELRKTIPPVGA